MADLVAARLRTHGLAARTVQIKIRFPDFTTITRAHTLPTPTDLGAVIGDTARTLLRSVDVERGVRLLGVTALQFDGSGAVQEALPFDAPTVSPEQAELERTLDAVRARFGPDAVGRAVDATEGRVRTDRRGSLWGPDDETGE